MQPPPPPPEVTPSDPKSAKAAAKAAKAHAKALRPWYKKKRFILSGLILIIIIAASANASNKTTNAGTTLPISGATATRTGCLAKPAPYPGRQSSDCVALANNTTTIAGTVVTATWMRTTNLFGAVDICAAVSIKNNNSGTISYNDLYWRLQTPSGVVEDSNLTASNDLGSGSLVGGGTVTGNVCFHDPAQSGTYVGIYKPDPFSSARGIWLFPLN
ncbi:MAG: DUF4352 domain-containing protein [Acidimicrobiales bacterium]